MSEGMNVTIHAQVRAYLARPDYEQNVRRALETTMAHCGTARIVRALGVFLLSENTRTLLADNDPAAVRQALEAIDIKLDSK